MLKEIVKIRIKQATRSILGIGIFRVVFLIIMIGLGIVIVFAGASKNKTAYYISAAFLLLLLIIQLRRKDKKFLRTNFYNYKIIFLFEYLTLSIPLTFCLIYYSHFLQMIGILLSCVVVINLDIKINIRTRNTKLQELLPSDSYEWKSGVRKYFFFIIFVLILALSTSFFVASVPVAIFAIGILIISFYENNEPWQMLEALELSAPKLLLHKIKRQFILFLIIVAPLIIAFIVFHPELWYIVVVEFVAFVFVYSYIIVLKYAFYEPNIKTSSSQILTVGGIFIGFIPPLLPILWIMTAWFYFKAVDNLKNYLNAYNQ